MRYNGFMVSESGVLARNTSYFTLALVAQKVISFLYFTFLARILGPAVVGKYVLALAITTIFSVLIDLGLASVLTREVAKQPDRAQEYFGQVIGFKSIVSLLVVGLVVATVNIIGYPESTRQLVYLASAVMVLDSFTLSVYSTIRGFQNLLWESIGTILMQVTVAVIGWLVASFTHDLRMLMAALIIAAATNAVYALTKIKSRYRLSWRPIFSWAGWRHLARLSWPFAAAAILTRVYGYIDSVLLSLLANDTAVGIYSVAYKLTFALQFIPSALAASLFPGLSFYFSYLPEKLEQTFSYAVVYLSAIALPISIGLIILAEPVITAVYPAYDNSILPLQILMASLVFLFLTFPIGSLLPACNRQVRHTLNIAVATVLNVALNLYLIPRFGVAGAAMASLVSTVVLFGLGWAVVVKIIVLNKRFLWLRLSRVALAGIIMGLTIWQISSQVNLAISILFSGLVYAGALVVLGGVTTEEIKNLFKILRTRTGFRP